MFHRELLLVWALSAAALGLAGVNAYRDWTFDDRVPVFIERAEALNSPLAEGEVLIVRVYRDKVRDDCPITSNRTAMDMDGRPHDLPNLRWEGAPANTEFADIPYDTSALPPGEYWLRVDLDYQCPGFVFEVEQPPVPFRVLAREEMK